MATDYEPETLLEITPEGLYRELSRISESIRGLNVGQYTVRHMEPAKPRQGFVVYADGTDWNPGSGEGIYRYNGTAWVYVG